MGLRDWWTDEDRAEFKKRTSKLVEQYSAFKPFDDLNVSMVSLRLVRTSVTLGGISIGLLAYNMSLEW